MNTSVLHPSGALLLEPIGQVVIEVKMSQNKDPIPITYDTPADKIKGQLYSMYVGRLTLFMLMMCMSCFSEGLFMCSIPV